MILLSKVLFANEKEKEFEAMFSRILVDKHITNDQRGKLPCNVYLFWNFI